jgi:DNA-binding FrmR family transcriptional regulator
MPTTDTAPTTPSRGYTATKDQLQARLARIEGQVRGIERMVDEDRYCIDVLTQISAATKALQSVAMGLFDDHLRHCVAEAAAAGGPEADKKLTEATAAVARLIRS